MPHKKSTMLFKEEKITNCFLLLYLFEDKDANIWGREKFATLSFVQLKSRHQPTLSQEHDNQRKK